MAAHVTMHEPDHRLSTGGFRIETDRLVIRPWEPMDEPGFREMVTDSEMMRYISNGAPWGDERIDEFFARQRRHLATRGHCLGALVERSTGRLAGLSGLQPLGTTADVEIGWWVMKDSWGRGFGSEAGAGVLRYAWDTLGLERVTAIAAPENRPSIRIMAKLGLRFERRATGRELGLAAAPDVEVVVYAIERSRDRDTLSPASKQRSWPASSLRSCRGGRAGSRPDGHPTTGTSER